MYWVNRGRSTHAGKINRSTHKIIKKDVAHICGTQITEIR